MPRHSVLPILSFATMVLGLISAMPFATGAAMAQGAVEKFYTGKTLQIRIGGAAGDRYDRYARVIGRHFYKYVPGQPRISFKNMGGDGSRKLTGWLYNPAPTDGLVLGAVLSSTACSAIRPA